MKMRTNQTTTSFVYLLQAHHQIQFGQSATSKKICERYIQHQYSLEIIDIYQNAALAEQEQLIALPLLIKKSPLPERRLIGDMSDNDKVLRGLGLLSKIHGNNQ